MGYGLPCHVYLWGDRLIAVLDCEFEAGVGVGVYLEKLETGLYQGSPGSRLTRLSESEEEETEMIDMYLLIDKAEDQSAGSIASCINFKRVLSEIPCLAQGITLSSQHAFTGRHKYLIPKGNQWHWDPAQFQIQKEQNKYLSRDLRVQENEATYVELVINSRLGVGLVVGLRHGQPKLRFIKTMMAYTANWSEIMLSGQEDWDHANDFDQILTKDKVRLQMEAKKTNKGRPIPCQWNVNVTILDCSCGATDKTGADCTCVAEDRSFVDMERMTFECQCRRCKPTDIGSWQNDRGWAM